MDETSKKTRSTKDPYECPRCGFTTSHKSHMQNHFYKTKKPCPGSRNDLEMTDTIKEHILKNRVYKIPDENKITNQTINNYNTMVNYLNNVDVIQLLEKYMEHRNLPILDYEEYIESRYARDVRPLKRGTEHIESAKKSKQELIAIIDESTKYEDEVSFFYDTKSKRINLYEGSEWCKYTIVTGIGKIIYYLQEQYTNYYEVYLIKKLKDNNSHFEDRIKAIEPLTEYYKFLNAFEMTPFVMGKNDSEIIAGWSSDAHALEEEFFKKYNESHYKPAEVRSLRNEVRDIILSNSKVALNDLNKKVQSLMRFDSTFKQTILELMHDDKYVDDSISTINT